MRKKEADALREQRELVRLRRLREKKPYAGYILFFCATIALMNIADEVASNVNGHVQSSVVTEFIALPLGLPYTDALGSFAAISSVLGVLSLLSPFYKSLSDRIGRKPFIVMNMLGLALGLTLCRWSPNIVVYLAGLALITFFVQHDLQVIYLFEVAPADKRARIYAVAKCLGTLGLAIIPLLRRRFMGDDPTLWREVFRIPIIMTAGVALLALALMRESRVYIDSRISRLELPAEQRAAKQQDSKLSKKENKAGVFNALRYIFTHDRLKWLALAYFAYGVSMLAMGGYVESIMTNYGMSTAQVTGAQLVYPFVYGLLILAGGFVGDGKGRRTVSIICASLAALGFLGFNLSAMLGLSPHIVGLFYGIYLGDFWIAGDYMSMMAAETAPTEIRSSVLGGIGLIMMSSGGVGMLLMVAGLFLFDSVGLVCMLVGIPPIITSIVLLAAKVKETKGADLSCAGREEQSEAE